MGCMPLCQEYLANVSPRPALPGRDTGADCSSAKKIMLKALSERVLKDDMITICCDQYLRTDMEYLSSLSSESNKKCRNDDDYQPAQDSWTPSETQVETALKFLLDVISSAVTVPPIDESISYVDVISIDAVEQLDSFHSQASNTRVITGGELVFGEGTPRNVLLALTVLHQSRGNQY